VSARVVPVVVALGLGLAGCGSQTTNPLCGGTCPTVAGKIERCGGPAPGECTREQVEAVSLLDVRGRVVTREHAERGSRFSAFRISAEVPGRYVLLTSIAGQRVRQKVTLDAGQTDHVNLVEQVK
jgi:hypothetical protein